MRPCRNKLITASHYFCTSRCINREFLLQKDAEKERLLALIFNVADFTGVTVLGYCIMDNHFHVLVYVPDNDTEVSFDELCRRLKCLYGEKRGQKRIDEILTLKQTGLDALAEQRIASYRARMHDVSEYMKTVKQDFTESYNKRNKRSGTLWGGRFHSTLVEADNPDDMPLLMMGAYIDLNPVRAGMVNDPKSYRWCTYGAAVAGNARAREGIKHLLECYDVDTSSWDTLQKEYRQLIYQLGLESKGDEWGEGRQRGFSEEAVDAVEEQGGDLPWPEQLKIRISYFSVGLVLGSQVFVEDFIAGKPEFFSSRARPGPKRPPPLAGTGLHTPKYCR